MVLNSRRLAFPEYKDLAAHLNTWSARHLNSSEEWSEVLASTRDWLDYSGRNQLMLASYELVDGPVAGPETWRLVPSTSEGRNCAVRAGEHGWPIRVPVTTTRSEPDPYLGGSRPTRSAVERWETRYVFSVGQLARRPAPGALVPVDVPASLSGPQAEQRWLDAARQVAQRSTRARPSASASSERLLADAAARTARSGKGPDLEREHYAQVAWMVADRVGLSQGPMPTFDPGPYQPRDRWPILQSVLETTRKLTGTLGVVLGVDLTASPLPRMEIVDDRAVPAGSRRQLPASSVANLPLGRWEHVGPYTAEEWAARGEDGAGRGAYLRVADNAYVVAIENGPESRWRLHDDSRATDQVLQAGGEAPSLAEAKDDATAAVGGLYPGMAHPQLRLSRGEVGPSDAPSSTDDGSAWHRVPGEGNSSAQQLRIDVTTTAFVFPGPGGNWLPAVQTQGEMQHLPNVRSEELAREAAERAGRRMALLASLDSPVQLDQIVADIVTSPDYSREDLVAIVGSQLFPADRDRLAEPELPAADLVEILGQAGITPATTARVLRAEGIEASEVAGLLPIAGVPMDHAIRMLHQMWEVPRLEAARLVGANAIEMRAAGCTADEVLGLRPKEVLRVLPDDPRTWGLAAGTMAQTTALPRVVSHLVAHAPSAEAFASGLAAAAMDDGIEAGFAHAVRFGAQGEQLAAVAAFHDLDDHALATLLADTGSTPQVAVEAIFWHTDFDERRTAELAKQHLGMDAADVGDHLGVAASIVEPSAAARPERHLTLVRSGDGSRTAAESQLNTPSPAPTDSSDLLRVLPEPEPAAAGDGSLLDLLPQPEPVEVGPPDPGGQL